VSGSVADIEVNIAVRSLARGSREWIVWSRTRHWTTLLGSLADRHLLSMSRNV